MLNFPLMASIINTNQPTKIATTTLTTPSNQPMNIGDMSLHQTRIDCLDEAPNEVVRNQCRSNEQPKRQTGNAS